jgi:HPt (histidine-containing phosphotransfer) domain-containing protein
MTELVVDLSNLREATDGDRELEQELFEEYITSSQELVSELDDLLAQSGDNESWRKAAHALKGISANLGANRLAEISKHAQDSHEDDNSVKHDLLSQIREEHKKVIDFLNNLA